MDRGDECLRNSWRPSDGTNLWRYASFRQAGRPANLHRSSDNSAELATFAMNNYSFGPVPSRRLDRSLGVDLVPLKTCSYDCIYCQLGRTTCKTIQRKEWVPLDTVLSELESKLSLRPDYITLSINRTPQSVSCSWRKPCAIVGRPARRSRLSPWSSIVSTTPQRHFTSDGTSTNCPAIRIGCS